MAQRRRLNRALVVAQAVQLADASGDMADVTLAELASALNIRPPSLYNHVSGLDDLRAAVRVYALRQLLAELREATHGLVGEPALRALVDASRRYMQAHPGIYPLTVRGPDQSEPEAYALSQNLVQLMQLILASMGISGDDAIHAIRGLRAMLHGFAMLEAADGFRLAVDPAESFRRLLDSWLAGLGTV